MTKNQLIALILIILLLISPIGKFLYSLTYMQLTETYDKWYNEQIDTDCNIDSDCIVKYIGCSDCGGISGCANKNSINYSCHNWYTCAGKQKPTSCECVSNKCQGKYEIPKEYPEIKIIEIANNSGMIKLYLVNVGPIAFENISDFKIFADGVQITSGINGLSGHLDHDKFAKIDLTTTQFPSLGERKIISVVPNLEGTSNATQSCFISNITQTACHF